MLLQRFHLALASAAAAVVVLGFVAGASVWHVEAAARAVLSTEAPTGWMPLSVWLVSGVTLAVLAGLVAASYTITRSFHRSLSVLWQTVDDLQAGRPSEHVPDDWAGDWVHDELLRAAHALHRTTRTLSEHTVSRSYLHDVLDSMAEMLFVVGADGRIRHVNRAVTRRLQTTTDALTDTPLADLFDTDPLSVPTDVPVERTFTARTGGECPVLVSRATLRGSEGDPETVCVAQDVTALKTAEAALQQSLHEKEVLLREVHHRVKNNLQVVCSLLHVEQQSTDDADARRRFEAVQHRIRSMAAIHEQLYRSDDLSQVDFGAYLRDLADDLATAHGRSGGSLEVDAEAVAVPVSAAIPAGIIVNELVANAFEHAYAEGEAGTVRVSVHRSDDGAVLRVCDDGAGPAGWDARAASGTGLRLVRGLARQLHGTFETTTSDGGGTCATVTFPLSPAEAVGEEKMVVSDG
jgi:PAS domain S-box-containing protein